MSDTGSQLAEVDALIAAAPDDPALRQLRQDLLQLIALEVEEQELAGHDVPGVETAHPSVDHASQRLPLDVGSNAFESSEKKPSSYTAQGTFMEHVVSKEAVAEAPDLGAFQPVVSLAKSAAKSLTPMKSGDAAGAEAGSGANLKDDITNAHAPTTATTKLPTKKKKKKKKGSDDAVLDAKFELPSHLVPLESDTPAQKLKKQRTAKTLKSKFREKQKEAEHSRRQNDWKSFASKAGGKRKAGGFGGSIFSTEEGVNARVGVISGGGGRKMTDFADPNKRHKFS